MQNPKDRVHTQEEPTQDSDAKDTPAATFARSTVTQNGGAVGGLKHRYDESLEMDMHRGPLRHSPAKLITVTESIAVLQQQQQQHKVSTSIAEASEKDVRRESSRISFRSRKLSIQNHLYFDEDESRTRTLNSQKEGSFDFCANSTNLRVGSNLSGDQSPPTLNPSLCIVHEHMCVYVESSDLRCGV